VYLLFLFSCAKLKENDDAPKLLFNASFIQFDKFLKEACNLKSAVH